MYVGNGPALVLTWADGGSRIDIPFTSSTTAGFLSKTVDFALVYDSTTTMGRLHQHRTLLLTLIRRGMI